MSAIAIVGMACRYAEARSPRELWENVLAQRRSFRQIPRVRLRVEDYSASAQDNDRISLSTAAVLEDYEFDRARFHISKDTFVSTDLTHWLALDVAARALEDARLLNAGDRQRERTGVYVGNSLTGEFSRANLMRLRWPYVRRVLTAILEKNAKAGADSLAKLLAEIEELYKAPFPATTEDSLAGGLSNTIAGRICNYFDLKGGGYTVDGACASSLLAVTTACSALASDDVDIALAGGVDLSLDPFELAGFTRLGALAGDKMRVFDEQSSGFWPGEGCGVVVLMRHEDALAHHYSPYAVIRGWGISSDGNGGITRPEPSGQLLALQRAYQRAGFGIDSVGYLEGHGTGTSVGDAAELQALSMAIQEAGPKKRPVPIGSIKANIGHTKAAAGVAGLIKAAMAVQSRLLPPTTGCDHPHAELRAERPALRVLKHGELWPEDTPLRASVSAMGFGGINSHVALEAADTHRRITFAAFEQKLLCSSQDCELFLFHGADRKDLARQMETVLQYAGQVSYAELADLAASLALGVASHSSNGGQRAACVAATPAELEKRIRKLLEWCAEETGKLMDSAHGLFAGAPAGVPRIAFLFPGQASPVLTSGGAWSRRFPEVHDLYENAALPQTPGAATEIAQPCVVTASLAGLAALRQLGIDASLAVGHSLGELTALCWAGAIADQDLLRIVAARGRIMSQMADPSGTMASVRAGWLEAKHRLNGDPLVIAAHNSPSQSVVAGEAHAVRRFVSQLKSDGISATMLPVSHAFHSPLVAKAAVAFSEYLSTQRFGSMGRPVVSTVTGTILQEETDLQELLTQQITDPVQFEEAITVAAAQADLLIEVGPGSVLSAIAAECTATPVIALNTSSDSLRGLMLAAGAAFVMGTDIRFTALFEDRFHRPFDLQWKRSFLRNPCEAALDSIKPARLPAPLPATVPATQPQAASSGSSVDMLRKLVAQRTELPLTAVLAQNRFLDDLHLNSITISQIILEAAGQLEVPPPPIPAEYTNSTIAEAAQALENLRGASLIREAERHPQGVSPWIRALEVELVEQPLRPGPAASAGIWRVVANSESPLCTALEKEFRMVAGDGFVCRVPEERDEGAAMFLFDSVQKALKQHAGQIVFVQNGAGASSLARTLHLENPGIKVTVVNVPCDHPPAANWVAQETRATSGFTEAHYDAQGIRREPRLKVLWPDHTGNHSGLNADDLLVVTGGGKGIAAECALKLAKISGCQLALIGRSEPALDQELQRNLLRFRDSGVRFRYFAADVTDREQVGAALQRIAAEMGPVTAMLHGAGVNIPARIDEITVAGLHDTLAPKLQGLRHVLDHLKGSKLRLLITFGSIIGRTGLHGEAHYGLANEWLTEMVEDWQAEHSDCRCLNLEWSVWAGAGMGQRLGVLDSLVRQGITPLPMDEAIDALGAMLAWKQAPTSAIVTGRFGHLPALRFREQELPLLRFLEHIPVHHPGIELIADAELTEDSDPYVKEHAFQGEQLLPAVVGMEAMAQAAMALENSERLPQFENLRFMHPIVIPKGKGVRIRIAALRREPGRVSVVIRCSNTSFQVDHFTGECDFKRHEELTPPANAPAACGQIVALDPSQDLYGQILFHQGRFRRIEKYHRLHACESIAGLMPPENAPWYARHLPAALVLGDPASRDAAIHSIQACIPHKTILPVGVDRIVAAHGWTRDPSVIHAVERSRDGDNFVYDIRILDSQGQLCERWEGLHLRAVAPVDLEQPWPVALLSPYLERKLAEFLPSARVKVTLTPTNDRDTAEFVQRIAGPEARLVHRPDGKPEITSPSSAGAQISLSYSGQLTLIVGADRPLGCDLEEVVARDEPSWTKLLGNHWTLAQLLAETSRTPIGCAATQVWTLMESLRKSGAGFDHTLRRERTSDSWTIFSSGDCTGATFCTRIRETGNSLAVGIVVRSRP